MSYGLEGRIESYVPPVGNAVQYHYDLGRRMDLIDFGPDVLGQSHQVDFVYDEQTGRLSNIVSPTGTIQVGYTNGHMTSLTSPSMNGPLTTNIAYDGFLPTSVGWSGAVAGNVSWTYNDRFLIASETIGALPSTRVNYSYDRDGLVTQAGALSIQRDPTSGRVLSKTIGNLRETYQYNELGELARQTVVRLGSGGSVIETLYDVVYDDNGLNGDRDAMGRIVKKTEWIVSEDSPTSGARPLNSRTYEYGYNQSGRPWLESVAVDGTVVSSYGYDANGNRTSAELAWSQLGYSTDFDASLTEADTEYDAADKLLRYGTKEYSWNNFGQLASVYDSATGEETSYQYDLYGNLLSVALPDGRTIEYDVDGAGRRVGRRVLDSNGVELEFRGWIYRDLLRPIAEVDAAGNVVARYVYSNNNTATAPSFPSSIITETAGDRRTLALITDQVGSLRLVVDTGSGEILQRTEYDEFGIILNRTGSVVLPFGYAGGFTDEDHHLLRFRHRDYDPQSGRWTNRDKSLFGGGQLNVYSYVDGDSINYVDPWGLMKLPPSPDGLPPDWVRDPSHKDPNGSRYRHPSGDYIDFHHGRPGAKGWKGEDHYHHNGGKRHIRPGSDVPDPDPVCNEPNESSGPVDDNDPLENHGDGNPDPAFDPLNPFPGQIPILPMPFPFPFPIFPTPVPMPFPGPIPA